MQSLLLFLLVPALISAQSLVLIGGSLGEDNVVLLQKMVELSGGPGAKIGLLTMAADDPQLEAQRVAELFAQHGANATWIPVTTTSNNADDSAVVSMTVGQDGFFFATGTRSRVLTALRRNDVDSQVLTAIRVKLRAGAMVAGNSAGMAVLGKTVAVLTGGTWAVLADPSAGTVNTAGGLGLFEAPYMLDAQCSDQGREGRLIRMLQNYRNTPTIGTTRGLCIDGDHALVVTDLSTQPTGTVIGDYQGGVKIFDVTNMVVGPTVEADFRGAYMASLTLNDTVDLTTGVVTIARWKPSLAGYEANAVAVSSNDIFSTNTSGRWQRVADILIDNRRDNNITSFSSEQGPQFQVIMTKTKNGNGGFYPNDPSQFYFSYTDVQVDIYPV